MHAKTVIQNLEDLNKLTSDEMGAQRVAWGPVWRHAREWFINKAKDIGAEIEIDAAGNLFAKISGKKEEGIMIGSHLDSVPNGGPLDGCLGVVTALEVLTYYSVPERRPEFTLYAVDWADEEGANFSHSLLGSSAASGFIDINDLLKRVDKSGVSMKDVLAKNQVDLQKMSDAHTNFKAKKIVSYLELHIEQGPVLESMGKGVAAVYGVTGTLRHFVKFKGQSAHAGSFPVKMRQDAFLAAAEAALAFRDIALKHNAVCTVGKVSVNPDVATIIPGECSISLDARSIDSATLHQMHKEAKNAVCEVEKKNGVVAEWELAYAIEPTIFDHHLTELCKDAVREECGEATAMFSGPLHDAARMASLVPSTMMFVSSTHGLSHCKEEHTPGRVLETGINAFFRLVRKVVLTSL